MLRLRGSAALFFIFTLFHLSLLVAAQLVNHTIDDTNGDSVTGAKPTYYPSTAGVWAGASCGSACAIQPDPSQAFDGTWSAATYKPQNGMTSMSIEIPFTGTAIYVFFILANNAGNGIVTQTACNFTLDGQGAGSYSHTPSSSTQMQYNALVFSNTNLPNSFHNLVISSSGSAQTFVNFDYAIYTVDNTPSVTPSAAPNAATAPGASSSASHSTTNNPSSPNSSSSTTNTARTNSSSGPTGVVSNGSSSTAISNNSGAGASSATSASSTTGASVLTTSHTNNSTVLAAAVGGAVGGVVILLIIFFLLFRRYRRNSNRNRLAPMLPVPFDGSPTSFGSNHPISEFFPGPVTGGKFSSQGGSQATTGLQDPRYSNQISTSAYSILARPLVSDGKQRRQMQEDLLRNHPQTVREVYEPPPGYAD